MCLQSNTQTSIDTRDKINISKFNIKSVMENMHQNTIKHLTYLILNKK